MIFSSFPGGVSSNIRLCKGLLPFAQSISLFLGRSKGGESVKQSKTLDFRDRKAIATMYEKNVKVALIAETVGVAPSTIYTELQRGRTGKLDKDFRPHYDPVFAQKRAQEALHRRGRKKEIGRASCRERV